MRGTLIEYIPVEDIIKLSRRFTEFGDRVKEIKIKVVLYG